MKFMDRVRTGLILILVFSFYSEPVFSENKGDEDLNNKKPDEVEHILMGGTEIQGTLEKPHVVYVVPWNRETTAKQDEIPFERSFKNEILETIDYLRFKRQWGEVPAWSKGGETP